MSRKNKRRLLPMIDREIQMRLAGVIFVIVGIAVAAFLIDRAAGMK